jgi:hypothetical protein
MADSVRFAFEWVRENAGDLSCETSIGHLIRNHLRGKSGFNEEHDGSSAISMQLRSVLDALAYAVSEKMPAVHIDSNESHCADMMHNDQLGASAVMCLLVELPMAIFERDTTFVDGKRFLPRLRHALVPNCTSRTAAGRFLVSMISTLFLLHQRVCIDLPELDDALTRAAGSSGIIVLSSFGGSQDFDVDNPNAMFPLNLQQSAIHHSVEGVLFYTHGQYIPPLHHAAHFKLNNVFEWNCLEFSPFARDPDSFCRSLIAGEICKRGLSVYNIDPDSVFLHDINRTKHHFGHLSMSNYYFTHEEMWLNFSMHIGRMNNFGQWYLQSQSPFSIPWSFFVHLLATDLRTTSDGTDTPMDDIVSRYNASTRKDGERFDLSFLGASTQCGDDQHVFNDFFQFFAQDSSARFVRRVHRRDKTVLSDSVYSFLDFRILTGQETAMAVSYCRGSYVEETVTVHLTTYGDRQHKPTCLREQGSWYLDALLDESVRFRGRFVALDDAWFGALVTRFQEGEASQVRRVLQMFWVFISFCYQAFFCTSNACCPARFHAHLLILQWLICYARKHGLIPVLPAFRCSWTAAARSDWTLPERCSWYMRYSFPGNSASYRDHTFLRKFSSLAGENASFTVSTATITTLDMVPIFSDSSKGSLGSMLVVHPQFWRESSWSWLIRDWLPFLHGWISLQHQVADQFACMPLIENPRAAGCC